MGVQKFVDASSDFCNESLSLGSLKITCGWGIAGFWWTAEYNGKRLIAIGSERNRALVV